MDLLTPRPDRYDVPYAMDSFNAMPYRKIGGSGLSASAIGLGTWKFGYPDTGDASRVDGPGSFAILDRSIELGVTFWDTANRYNNGSGNSERIIGRWFRANPDQRRDVVLATKVHGGMDGYTPNHCGLSRGAIVDALDASLARLQLDYVDVLYFHRPDPSTPVEESLETVDDLVRAGKIRYLAVSNFSVDQLSELVDVAGGISRRCRPVAVQNQFDPVNGETDDHSGVLKFCAENSISYVPYSPLGRGLLTGRYLDPAKVGAGDRLHDEGSLGDLAGQLDQVRSLAKLAQEWELEVSQLALAYLLTLPGMGPQIPSSSNVDQLESNAKAGKVTLTDDQVGAVNQALA
ncbi:aldo/keto reductase [Microlunatus speluncae]|uniref:aldo/keto reductase n=1 Tax=Microlunatus speluncae TaxID=2594267 RepID=UPI0012661F0E|nr:aldo/keto reductase [Microlunatus speluncae]